MSPWSANFWQCAYLQKDTERRGEVEVAPFQREKNQGIVISDLELLTDLKGSHRVCDVKKRGDHFCDSDLDFEIPFKFLEVPF